MHLGLLLAVCQLLEQAVPVPAAALPALPARAAWALRGGGGAWGHSPADRCCWCQLLLKDVLLKDVLPLWMLLHCGSSSILPEGWLLARIMDQPGKSCRLFFFWASKSTESTEWAVTGNPFVSFLVPIFTISRQLISRLTQTISVPIAESVWDASKVASQCPACGRAQAAHLCSITAGSTYLQGTMQRGNANKQILCSLVW